MVIVFTDEEKKWISVSGGKRHGLVCKDGAPEKIKKSVEAKLAAHREWAEALRKGPGNG